MYVYKSISKSDYSIRNFRVYKTWSFPSGSDTILLNAEDTNIYYSSNDVSINDFTYNKHSLLRQLKSNYYTFTDTQMAKSIRVLNNKAKVIAIPNTYLGDGIKPGSLSLYDADTVTTFTDNTSGSLLSGSLVVGDIFYNNGIIVYTHTSSVDNRFLGKWNVDFKSSETITEHEILVSTGKNEFNVSTNPTALSIRGAKYKTITNTMGSIETLITDPGIRYIRKKTIQKDGVISDYRFPSRITTDVSGGFEHYELSSSVDTTGSFLTPFATTIGLYDDSGSLLVVAKLPRPIKMEPGYNINFIVRFDT